MAAAYLDSFERIWAYAAQTDRSHIASLVQLVSSYRLSKHLAASGKTAAQPTKDDHSRSLGEHYHVQGGVPLQWYRSQLRRAERGGKRWFELCSDILTC